MVGSPCGDRELIADLCCWTMKLVIWPPLMSTKTDSALTNRLYQDPRPPSPARPSDPTLVMPLSFRKLWSKESGFTIHAAHGNFGLKPHGRTQRVRAWSSQASAPQARRHQCGEALLLEVVAHSTSSRWFYDRRQPASTHRR